MIDATRSPSPIRRRLMPSLLIGLMLLSVPYATASAGSSEDYDAYLRAREERRLMNAKRQARRESERRATSKLRKLERKLEAGKRDERRKRYGRRYGYRQYSDDGQAGAHCMYGGDGKLIYAPKGARCAAYKGGPVPGPAAAATTVTQGCASGDCRDGEGTYVWADGSRYTGGFRGGLQHGQGSIAFTNGASYTGAWDQGKRSGMGTAIYPDGRVKAGRWKDNRYLGGGGGDGAVAAAEEPKIDWPDLSRPAPAIGGGDRDVAIVVGIEDYAHVADVPGAQQNAVDWYRYLTKTRGIPSDRVTLLLDEDATREEIRIAAEEGARLAGRKGHLWFVFIGHGAPSPGGDDGLLIGFDAQQKARSLSTRSLARSDLLEVLEQSRARRIHVLLDACFSGKNASGEQLIAGLQPLVVTSTAPTSDERTTLMTAAASDEYAGPLPGAERPAFSYLVLGGLRGWADDDGDGEISAGELHGFTSKAMRSTIRGRRQTPTFVGQARTALVPSAAERAPDLGDLALEASLAGKAR